MARKYLTIRENAVSWNQKSPTQWVDEARPVLTDQAHKHLAQITKGASGGNAWNVAHDKGLAVRVTVQCHLSADSGVDTPTHKIIVCGLTDQTVDKTGKPVATTEIPPMWPFAGIQPPALLDMRKQHGKWLVDADMTGQAS